MLDSTRIYGLRNLAWWKQFFLRCLLRWSVFQAGGSITFHRNDLTKINRIYGCIQVHPNHKPEIPIVFPSSSSSKNTAVSNFCNLPPNSLCLVLKKDSILAITILKSNFSNLTQCSLYHFHFTRFSNPRITMHEQPRFLASLKWIGMSFLPIDMFVAPVSKKLCSWKVTVCASCHPWMSGKANVTPYHYSLVLIHLPTSLWFPQEYMPLSVAFEPTMLPLQFLIVNH